MADLPQIIDHTGEVRRLGTIPAHASKRFSIWPRANVIPQADWWEVDRSKVFTSAWIIDQDGQGGCVGFSAANAFMRARSLANEPLVRLSGEFVYAQINGGRDQGAIIEDAMAILTDMGVATEAEVPLDSKYINKNNIPKAAYETAKTRFRAFSAMSSAHGRNSFRPY